MRRRNGSGEIFGRTRTIKSLHGDTEARRKARSMTFNEFTAIEFAPSNPSFPGFIYVLFWVRNGVEQPFYVGQTKTIWRRLDDYYWAQFQACTDFRVGEAVKYFSSKSYSIMVKYKACTDSLKEERKVIDGLHLENRLLLNDFRSYNYRTADEEQERAALKKFIDCLVEPALT
jgi:hypothetical protein